MLTAGDSIHIPKFVSTVRVEGAVYSPTSVTFMPRRKVDYYVEASGGDTFVQQPNGLIRDRRGEP